VSLLSPERVDVALFANRVLLTRSSSGLRRRLLHKEIVSVPAPAPDAQAWQGALDALGGLLAAGKLAKASLKLILSNQFVHYLVVPWRDELRSAQAQDAYVRHCFERIHGSHAGSWEIRLCSAKPGQPRLACAIDTALLTALQTLLRPLGARYRSLQPHLMASFNPWHARLGRQPSWLLVAEPGILCLALLQDGAWHSIHSLKVGPQWTEELAPLLAREEYLVESHTPCHEVLLLAPGAPQPLPSTAGKWRIHAPNLAAPRGMNTHIDALFPSAPGA